MSWNGEDTLRSDLISTNCGVTVWLEDHLQFNKVLHPIVIQIKPDLKAFLYFTKGLIIFLEYIEFLVKLKRRRHVRQDSDVDEIFDFVNYHGND